jgi:exopolysaccharide production protein ExoQ
MLDTPGFASDTRATVTGVGTLRRTLLASEPRAAALQVTAGLAAGLAGAIIAVAVGPLAAAGLAAGIALILISLRWPLVPLFIFVALVPLEDSLVIPGVGTLSRSIGIVFAGVYVIPRIGRLSLGALAPAGWALVGWAALSVLWAIRPDASIAALQTLLQLTVIAFLIADVVIHNPAVVRPLLWAYSISAALTAVFGVLAFGLAGMSTSVRVAALEGQNPAQYASLLLPAFIFCLNEAVNRRAVLVSTSVALLCLGGILLSGTRSVWLAAVIVVFLLMLPRLGPRRAIAVLIGVGLLALAIAQIPSVANLVTSRVNTATQTGGAGRTDIWRAGLALFEGSPVIGVGYGNFPYAVGTTAFHSAQLSPEALLSLAPHSVIVGPAVELGLVGLTLLALFVLPLVLRVGWGPDGAVVQAILAALMIDALFIDIFGYRKEVWIAIGLASGLAYLARQERRERQATPYPTLPDASPAGGSVTLPASIPTSRRAQTRGQVSQG